MKHHSNRYTTIASKYTLTLIALFLSSLGFYSCEDDENSNPQARLVPYVEVEKPYQTKIMSLGASRVQGARPNFESFRYELWKELIANSKSFEFVGTQLDTAKYNSFMGSLFDRDHEGRGGYTSAQILLGINNWLRLLPDTPNVVLFSSPGANDILIGLDYNQALFNINKIIDTIQHYNPKVTIVMEQLSPGLSTFMSTRQSNELSQMQQDVYSIANVKTTSSSRVIPVDMYTGFSDSLLADNVHYNVEGAKFIARRYFTVLDSLLE